MYAVAPIPCPEHLVLAVLTRPGQTFEGGISAQPNAEAHGGYAFCALAVLSILDIPSKVIPKYVTLGLYLRSGSLLEV